MGMIENQLAMQAQGVKCQKYNTQLEQVYKIPTNTTNIHLQIQVYKWVSRRADDFLIICCGPQKIQEEFCMQNFIIQLINSLKNELHASCASHEFGSKIDTYQFTLIHPHALYK